MTALVCPHCFRDFSASEMRYRCLEHDPPLAFRCEEYGTPPTYAPCPRGGHLCGIRLCPHCRKTLPYHIGRSDQVTVAVVGPRAAGKSLYLWALLHELRGRLAADPDPFAVAMFEDDASFAAHSATERELFVHRRLPASTQAKGQEKGDLPPALVRLWCGGKVTTLSLYDPAGELVENMQKIEFLSYLRHATAFIYLIPPPDPYSRDESLNTGASGLANVAVHLRRVLGVNPPHRLPRSIAVVLTQADDGVFGNHPADQVTPGFRWGPGDWRRGGRGDRRLTAASNACREVMRALGYDELVTNAERQFASCRFFAVSSLGGLAFGRDGLLDTSRLRPIGVECPLFSCLNEV